MREIVLPLGLLLVFAGILVPMPTAVLDLLLVGNLVLSLVLLMTALYLNDPVKLSALPTLLLLVTLYRVSLNVATTRLILTHGDAGSAVAAFGSVVVQGNVAVGAAIFLVITLVQFIVIAKGAERVAEVAARFTLDAMPGKQMSIDADVRAGVIDIDAARKKRQELQTESRFYGALDGAMKFIKGDAIAGLVILAINMIGGMIVGSTAHGLSLGAAFSKFGLLTIGDGILSQIPALLNALAAGVVVTRVSNGEGSTLAHDIATQLGQGRRPLVAVALLSCCIAFVPGMPIFPLVVVAGALVVMALLPDRAQPTQERNLQFFIPPPAALIELRLSAALAGELRKSSATLVAVGEEIRRHVYQRTGLIVPHPELRDSEELESSWQLAIRGVPYIDGPAEQPAATIAGAVGEAIRELDDVTVEELVDDQITRRTIDHLERTAPDLVAGVIPGSISLTQLSVLFKRLLREGVSLHNLDQIIQGVAECAQRLGTDRALLEEIRVRLRRRISQRLQNRVDDLRALHLAPGLDLAFARAEREQTPLLPAAIQALYRGIEAETKQQFCVVLASRAARMLVRDCLILHGHELPVLAHEEITSDLRFAETAVIGADGSDRDEIVGGMLEQRAA